MHYLKSLIATAVLVASASWSNADQSPSANEMIVEASRLIRAADSASTPDQAISLLEAAHRQLMLITEVHPSSDLAVKLATGQGIGTVSLAGVQAAIKAATERCWDSLSLLCVARLTVETAMSADRDSKQLWDRSLSNAAKAQAAAGQFDAAVKTAELIEHGGPRTRTLWSVVAAHAAAGQFSAAVKTAEMIDNASGRTGTLLDVAAAQRKAGKAEDAQGLMAKILAFAASIDDADDRARVFARITKAQAAAGQFSAAVETAASIDDIKRRANALLDVAEIQTKAGNSADARTTAKRADDTARAIQDPAARAQALNAVAASYTNMGDKERARATIGLAVEATQAVADVKTRLERLFEIAAAQTKIGEVESARATVDTAIKQFKAAKKDSGLIFTFTTAGIGNVPLEANQLTEVLAIFKSPEVQNVDGSALTHLALFLAAEGTVSNVMEVLKLKLRNAWDKDSTLGVLVLSQVEAAQFAAALKTAKLIEDLGDRTRSLARIAKARAEAGQIADARATIAEAIKTTRLIEDSSDRVLPLKRIAEAQAQAGQVAEARATIGLMTEAVRASGEDSRYLKWLAEVQVEAGLVRDAKDSLRKTLQALKQEIAEPYHFSQDQFSDVLKLLLKMHEASLL